MPSPGKNLRLVTGIGICHIEGFERGVHIRRLQNLIEGAAVHGHQTGAFTLGNKKLCICHTQRVKYFVLQQLAQWLPRDDLQHPGQDVVTNAVVPALTRLEGKREC